MFRKIPFVESELIPVSVDAARPNMPEVRMYNTPVSARENYGALYYEKKPFWIPMFGESRMFSSELYSERLGRGRQKDTVDVFGLHWEYVPSAGGSIVHPGNPILDDVNNWRKVITLPDVTKWDWAAEAEKIKIDTRYSAEMSFVNGFWFERLISFMDFMPAALALIDEDQTEAIKDLFQQTTDMACQLVDMFCEYWPALDMINVHDDWGAQKAPFFSEQVAYELFVPYMKQLTDHIHSKGRIATLHSCGHTEDRVQCYIDGGFDQWAPQTMNNIHELYKNYGDKMVFAVWPDKFDFENTTEEEQRAFARAFVDEFSQPGKPVTLSLNALRMTNTVFLEEVYKYSRQVYASR